MSPLSQVKSFLVVSLSVLLLVASSGCSESGKRVSPLRIGTHVWNGYEPLHLAKSLGHLDERIKLVEFASASNVIRAMKNGSIDGATLTLDEALVVKQDGIDIEIVLVNDFSAGADSILLNARHAETKSMKGLRIGVEGGAVGAYMLARALEVSGLSLADVTPVQLRPSKQRGPLYSGEVDGVVTFEPYRSMMLADGAVEVFNSRQIPGEIVDVTVVRSTSLKSNPRMTKNLVDSWFEALDFIRSQPDRAHTLMARRLEVSAEELQHGFELMHLPDRAETEALLSSDGELASNTRRLMQLMLSQRLLPASVDTKALFH